MAGWGTSWILLRQAWRQPWVGVLAVAMALWPFGEQVLAKWSFDATTSLGWGPVYELAFAGSLVGAAAGIACLSRLADGLGRLGSGERLWLELTHVLAMVFSVAAVPLLAGALARWDVPLHWGAWVGLALLVFQRSLLALVLLRLPSPAGLRILLLVALGWWIPALLAPSFLPDLERWIRLPLQLALSGLALETPGAWVVDMAPLVALLLAAWLGLLPAPRRR